MAHPITAPEAGSHNEEMHASSDKTYVMVAIFLAAMTSLEVGASYGESSLGALYVPVLLIMMVIKFFTVAYYFMHLKNDPAMCKRVFFFGLSVAVIIYVSALSTLHFWASGFR